MGVIINITNLIEWLKSGEKNVPVVPLAEWRDYDSFEYHMFVLPIDEGREWYFHKTAGEFSHTTNASIDLSTNFSPHINIRGLCDGLMPELEIDQWHRQMRISFSRRFLLMAPLSEAKNIINSGQTSNGTFAYPQEQDIEVPIAIDSLKDMVPTKYVTVHESMDGDGVIYSNQLAAFWMDSPRRMVVS
jgi:hypothetical protein